MIVTFVAPWYGPDVPGGAEAVTRRTAEHLAEAGLPVEVLTTCTRDLYADWGRNYHRPGVSTINGVVVRRFPVERRDRAAFDAINVRLMRDLPVSAADERVFIEQMIRSPELLRFIAEEASERLYVFIPYLPSTTYFGAQIRPDRSLLIPCLHDEAYARLGLYREVLPRVRALVFHTEAERQLAQTLFPTGPDQIREVIGAGVDTDWTADADRFRRTTAIDGPFMLYAGRREPGKNTPLLLDYWSRYWAAEGRARGAKLVLIGSGELQMPAGAEDGVIDLGFVPVQDKADAFAAAAVSCQPSLHESFSITLMESWLAGTPNLVHADCAVTSEHCVRSNGGLYFADYDEFAATTSYLLDHAPVAKRMGEQGRRYVLENYRWPVVIGRYADLFARLEAAIAQEAA
jgi:glycosyltransferase involved in cell wall biosynthesis